MKYFKVYWENASGFESYLFVETTGEEQDARDEALEYLPKISSTPFKITKVERK